MDVEGGQSRLEKAGGGGVRVGCWHRPPPPASRKAQVMEAGRGSANPRVRRHNGGEAGDVGVPPKIPHTYIYIHLNHIRMLRPPPKISRPPEALKFCPIYIQPGILDESDIGRSVFEGK